MTKIDVSHHERPVINLTKVTGKASYQVKVSFDGEYSAAPLTLGQLKAMVLRSTVTIEVNGVTMTFAARELGRARKSEGAYRLPNVEVGNGKRSKLAILELD